MSPGILRTLIFCSGAVSLLRPSSLYNKERNGSDVIEANGVPCCNARIMNLRAFGFHESSHELAYP